MKLLIVESPSKSKTIKQYLGSEFVILATFGHIMQLPSKSGSVVPENNFEMKYQISPNSKKHVASILEYAKKSTQIYLASDPDREGEAISWSVLQVLLKAKISPEKICRVTFTEITKSAIINAIKNPRQLDQDLVLAQQSRLSIDYLVGYSISPLLWSRLPGCKSAGRVQSVALKMIVEQEQKIIHFNPEEYWSVTADIQDSNNEKLNCIMHEYNGKKFNNTYPSSKEKTDEILASLSSANVSLLSNKTSQTKRKPMPPFITSTLQQDAFRKLGMTTKQTMTLAQKLYEGVEVAGQTQGLITYMRTDGFSLSGQAVSAIRDHIKENIGQEYMEAKPIMYSSKNKNAQEAHEAIRPTNMSITPEIAFASMEKKMAMLYAMIYNRTVASQMKPAVYDVNKIEFKLTANQDYAIIKNSFQKLVFDGFLKAYNIDTEDDVNGQQSNIDTSLPITLQKLNPKQHFTMPPPRFNEASLVKNLETLGIGRPSTYSSIISILQDRSYVELRNKRFYPTDIGIALTIFLSQYFSQYIEYDFTAKLESDLDEIANKKCNKDNFMQDFWKVLDDYIKKTKNIEVIESISSTSNKLKSFYLDESMSNQEFDKECPKCQTGKIDVILGKFGPFAKCNKYPECNFNCKLSELKNADKDSLQDQALEDNIVILDDEKSYFYEIKTGKYGDYIELQDVNRKKIKNCAIKGFVKSDLNPDLIKLLVSLPKKIGTIEDKDALIGIGPYGAYVKYDSKFYSIKGKDAFLNMTTELAQELIEASKNKKPYVKKVATKSTAAKTTTSRKTPAKRVTTKRTVKKETD